MKFRRIPADDKGFRGITSYEYESGRSFTVYGTGPEAEKAIREAMEKKHADVKIIVDG